MSQYVDEEIEGQVQDQGFDLNNPEFLAQLNEIVPNIDPDAIPKQVRPAPVTDGVHWVRLRLRGDKEEPVYFKGLRKDPESGKLIADSVVAILTVRKVNEDGTDGGFLKDWYASTAIPKAVAGAPPRGAALTAICKLAGKPTTARDSLPKIKAHVEQLFAEAGEEGIVVLAKTQWVKSVPKVQDIGGQLEYVFKDNGQKDYDEVRGENRIKKLAASQGIPEDQAHIWYEPKTNEERTVQAQIQGLEDPAKYPPA